MERLSDFAADIVNDLYENSDWYGDRSLIEAAINRLAAYEETGLEPEEIEQLKGEVFGLKVDKQELEQYRAIGSIDRLAAYEDTRLEPEDFKRSFDEDALLKLTGQFLGVTPDRLRELAQADREGRCVVLPCKVGETVYTTRWFDTVWETCTDSRGDLFRRKQFRHKVTKEKFSPFSLDYKDFGKTVFLTRAEAEAALEGMKNG